MVVGTVTVITALCGVPSPWSLFTVQEYVPPSEGTTCLICKVRELGVESGV